jgi:cytochrome c oxidase subunit 2
MCTERHSHRRRAVSTLRLAALCGVCAACNGTTSYLDATGTAGAEEAVLGRWLTAVACAVVVLLCAAVLAAIARHWGEDNAPRRRGRERGRADHGANDDGARAERREISSGLRWIWIGTAVTLVVLFVTFAGTMVTLNAASHPPREPSLIMDVTGHQWWWEVRYSEVGHPQLGFVTANEVHLPVGIPVRVRLHSADVIHSFWLPQIAGKTDVIPGQTNEMWIEARRPGVSRGMCGEYCGLQHAVMALNVTAESPQAFDAWTQARRAEAVPPTTQEAEVGRVVFVRTCGACHAVEGTNALGRMGPDLTHVASRTMIGAGALRNTPANLSAWVHEAQDVKEGVRMPEMPLDSAELRAVVAYLQTLR